MPTIVKEVPLTDVPPDWRDGLDGAATVRVTLECVCEGRTALDNSRLRRLLDDMEPIKPQDAHDDSAAVLARLREERLSRLGS